MNLSGNAPLLLDLPETGNWPMRYRHSTTPGATYFFKTSICLAMIDANRQDEPRDAMIGCDPPDHIDVIAVLHDYRVSHFSARINSAAFSPITIVEAFVLPPISVGMIEASATRNPLRPWTRS